MKVLGIDLAAAPRKTYACVLDDSGGQLRATVHAKCDDADLIDLAKGCRKVAIDAPFGWPNEFIDALTAHRADEGWPAPDDGEPEIFRASLSFRATDRFVMPTRRPLSVSTDKLGVTAMRCAHLLHRWSAHEAIDRTGGGRFVEVYPAGALVRWGLSPSGYKGGAASGLDNLLTDLCARLPCLVFEGPARDLCATSDDAFDALVAALMSRAAALGLTDGPPRRLRRQASQEGWIHLPAWGSLPFLGRSTSELRAAPAKALAGALQRTGMKLDGTGYVRRVEDVLLPSLSAVKKQAILSDLGGKGGSELLARGRAAPKFHAAHSSAALAANTFAPFLRERTGVPIAGRTFAGEVSLERGLPTGLGGTPPTLDCLVDGSHVLAVESKCTETFRLHTARFSTAYEQAMATMHKSWRTEFHRLAQDPKRYRYLDAAQLVKHYLGLRRNFTDRPITLAYLYWAPTNASEVASCSIHRAEVEEFVRRVSDPKVKTTAMSYPELWDAWSSPGQPRWLHEHAAALRRRYDVSV